jgi:hypothetical protein
VNDLASERSCKKSVLRSPIAGSEPPLTVELMPRFALGADGTSALPAQKAPYFVTNVTFGTKKPLLNDKPMTIEMPLFLEWTRDRPTGHP